MEKQTKNTIAKTVRPTNKKSRLSAIIKIYNNGDNIYIKGHTGTIANGIVRILLEESEILDDAIDILQQELEVDIVFKKNKNE